MSVQQLNCGCCLCCPYAYRELKAFGAIDGIIRFKWDGGGESVAFTGFVYNTSSNKWETPEHCGGEAYDLKFWCNSGQWFFNLISSRDGLDYSVPFSAGPGGATLLSCDPFQLYGEIVNPTLYADDFPFCGKTGSFPSGNRLDYFKFTAFE